jgi:hypothetical protein
MTVLLRNVLKGLGASMGILFAFPLFEIAIRWRWHIDLPIPPGPIGSLSQAISNIIWIRIAMLSFSPRSLSWNEPKYDSTEQMKSASRRICSLVIRGNRF